MAEFNTVLTARTLLFRNITPVGNVGGGEDDLMTATIAANTFVTNGDAVELEGLWTASGDGFLAALYVGATEILTVDVGDNDGGVPFRATLTRIDSDSLRVVFSGGSGWGGYVTKTQQIDSLNFSSTITVKTTGTGDANNDVVQRLFQGVYRPSPTA